MNPYALIRLLGALAALAAGCKPSPAARRQESPASNPANAGTQPTASPLPGSFAYVDPSGTQLLALGPLEDPARILGAICPRGLIARVRFDRTQDRQPDDNGRQIAANFSRDAGHVFRLVQGNASPDETCYLSADSMLLATAVPVTPLGLATCPAGQYSRLAAARQRKIVSCSHLAQTPARAELLALQFATIDSSALASLVLVRDRSLWFQDFPAAYRGPDEDVWRADDGGVFSPEALGILFVAELPHAVVMAITWAGAEGESDQLVLADTGDAFRTVVQEYRYWAPR